MFPYITLAAQTSTCHDTSVYMYQLSELSPYCPCDAVHGTPYLQGLHLNGQQKEASDYTALRVKQQSKKSFL